jgi:ketosteroid isomerase-like protein
MERKMTNPVEIVRSFYDKLKAGDAPGALGLMALDIEWIAMWHYKVNGRGPERVAEGLFKPLVAEWSSFALNPTEFIVDGDTVVSLGRFTGVHGTTGKPAEAGYAHVWTVRDGKIARFRQYIDTLAIAEARRS